MTEVKVTSNNQQGGITAQNVNVGNGPNTTFNTSNTTKEVKTETEGKAKKIFWWIFGIVGLISASLAIYKYLTN